MKFVVEVVIYRLHQFVLHKILNQKEKKWYNIDENKYQEEGEMFKRFFENFRKPKDNFGGRFMLKSMNKGHEKLASWGRSYINIENDYIVLDLGCGGGANIKYFLTKARNIEECFKEIYRVLKKGGQFLICNEVSSMKRRDVKKLADMIEMEVYTPDDLTKMLGKLGFDCKYSLDRKQQVVFIARK